MNKYYTYEYSHPRIKSLNAIPLRNTCSASILYSNILIYKTIAIYGHIAAIISTHVHNQPQYYKSNAVSLSIILFLNLHNENIYCRTVAQKKNVCIISTSNSNTITYIVRKCYFKYLTNVLCSKNQFNIFPYHHHSCRSEHDLIKCNSMVFYMSSTCKN